MDASRVGDMEAGDHTGRGAQAVGQSYASLADGVGESLVAGDHSNDVAATGQKQEFWLRYEGGAEGSSDVGSNIADGGGRGMLGRENRAEVPFNRLENKRFAHGADGAGTTQTAGLPRNQVTPGGSDSYLCFFRSPKGGVKVDQSASGTDKRHPGRRRTSFFFFFFFESTGLVYT